MHDTHARLLKRKVTFPMLKSCRVENDPLITNSNLLPDLALYSTSLMCVDTAVPTTQFGQFERSSTFLITNKFFEEYRWIPSNLQEIKGTLCIVGTTSFLGMRTLKMQLEHTQRLERTRPCLHVCGMRRPSLIGIQGEG